MNFLGELLRRIRFWMHRETLAQELEEEMQLHMELRAKQHHDHGADDSEALYQAKRQFGNKTLIQESSRALWGWILFDNFLEDLRYSFRMLRKTPAFAVIAILTIALGIGMNTAVFSVVSAVMLNSLPYPDPDRLVSLWEQVHRQPDKFNSSGSPVGSAGADESERYTVSVANWVDYCRHTDTFVGLAGFDNSPANLTGDGPPERIWGEAVTSNFFSVLGVQPALGRAFLAEEDRPGADDVVIISDGFWQRRFGRDPQVLGHLVVLDGHPHKVVGVLSAGFRSPGQFGLAEPLEFFVPAAYPDKQLVSHGDHDVNVVGRLKSGVSQQRAQAQLDVVSTGLAGKYPDTNQGVRAVLSPLQDDLVRGVRLSLLVLQGAVGLIVLVACLNVANLLLVRAIARRRDTSVRIALGASRFRVMRQFLTESLIVAFSGCCVGLFLGNLLTHLLISLAPATIPRLESATMDWRVLLVSMALALITGELFGMIPAWQVSQVQPADSLKSGERNLNGKSQVRWRETLTVAEVAVSMVLLIGAGLLLKSFVTVLGMDLGFRPERVLAMNINLPESKYADAKARLRFFEALENRVRQLPGIVSVAYANRMPMRGGWGTGIRLDSPSNDVVDVDAQAVSPGYFQTLGISLIRGRLLADTDRDGQPLVAVVNQAFARSRLGGGDPIGHRVQRTKQEWSTIVGVVNDIRRGGKEAEIHPQIYFPAAQTIYPVRLADFAVQTAIDPAKIVKSIQEQVWALDKDLPLTNVKTFDEIISKSVAQRRFQMTLLIVFASVALGLALVGIFGVLSQAVSQRTAELGIRMALGAKPSHIVRLVIGEGTLLVTTGVIIGVACAFALSQYVRSLLFGVVPHDWATYAAAGVLLIGVSLLVCLIPARRAGRVDPVVALRSE